MGEDESGRLKALVDTAVDGIILIDSAGTILRVNPACERLFGYAAAELLGNNVKQLMPEPYRASHDGYLERYQQTGEAKIIGIGREVLGQRKDGTVFPMHLSVGEAREEGKPVFVGIVHDLTELRNQELETREAAERLRAVVETAVDGVILIDRQGLIQMFNPACEQLFGYAANEVLGQNVKILMPAPYREEHDGYLRHYHSTGEARIIGIGREVEGRRKDGETFPMALSVGEAKLTSGSAYVGIIHDLTERKRTEEQLVQAQKMETVGQLAGGIAHDFNNLLTVIVGNAEELAESLTERPDLRAMAEQSVEAAERGAELTRRLLAFSRRQILRPESADAAELIQRLEPLLRRTLRGDVELYLDLPDDLWEIVVDSGQLEASLLNLAVNAQDAMPRGGMLAIAATNLPVDERSLAGHGEINPGNYVMLSVTDDGTGMDRETLERVFEPFFTTKEIGEGTGLGLSMVYGFAKQSDGHVTIYSEPELGTTVRLYLPASAGVITAIEPSNVIPFNRTLEIHEQDCRILVVEDDPFVRVYAVNCLGSMGFQVVSAENAREAQRRIEEGPAFDILFTDIVMPGGVNGWELAQRAEKLQPGIKVLLTSGYALDALKKARRLPPDASVLPKPYRRSSLQVALRDLLHEESAAG